MWGRPVTTGTNIRIGSIRLPIIFRLNAALMIIVALAISMVSCKEAHAQLAPMSPIAEVDIKEIAAGCSSSAASEAPLWISIVNGSSVPALDHPGTYFGHCDRNSIMKNEKFRSKQSLEIAYGPDVVANIFDANFSQRKWVYEGRFRDAFVEPLKTGYFDFAANPAAPYNQSYNSFPAGAPTQPPRKASNPPSAVFGAASMYNPCPPGNDSGEQWTASGEPYEPDGWTAAIQIELRGQFGGVRFGKNYLPVYALVESGDKRMIVKINDVGPLKAGRVIDLSAKSMRYLDPSLNVGLIRDVKVTPLTGKEWIAGPIGNDRPASVVAAQ